MKSLLRRIDGLLLQLATIFFGGILVCIVLQVIFRYVFAAPLVWSEELALYLFIWASLIAAAVTVGTHDHFSIPFIYDLLSRPVRRVLQVVIAVLSAVFALVVVTKGTIWSWRVVGETSPVISIPLPVVYGVIPLAAMYMFIHWITQVVDLFRKEREQG